MQVDLTKKKRAKHLIYGAVSVLLVLVCVIAISPYILGMTYTYSLIATILFRMGAVFWGAAICMIVLRKPITAWFAQR